MIVKLMLVLLFVLAVTFGVVVSSVSENVADEPVKHEVSPGKFPDAVINSRLFVQNVNPHREQISSVRSNELVKAFERISEAYAIGDVDKIGKLAAEIPGCVTNVHDQVLLEIECPLWNVFCDNFLMAHGHNDYDAEHFRRFAELNIAVALLLGDIELRRTPDSGLLVLLDCNTYRELKTYGERFREKGRFDCSAVADELLCRWVLHIESESGFLRRYMWRQLSVQRLAMERGLLNPEQAFSHARRFAQKLIDYGYTPKWLDEFTPEYWKTITQGLVRKGAQRDHGDMPPSEEEISECERIVEEICMAYSNRNVNVLVDLERKIPPTIFRLRGREYRDLIYPIAKIWTDEWSKNKEIRNFTTVSEFENGMRTFAALSQIYGRCLVKSELTANDVLVMIDCGVLERLQVYRESYLRNGQTEYAVAAEGLIADWKIQIESERGFAREYLRSQNKRLALLVKEGELTAGGLRQCVRNCIRPLSDICAYTPKWLDVEFPPLEEMPADK